MKNEIELRGINPAASEPPRERCREPKPKRVIVDFSVIEPAHAGIHARLENWARWTRGRYTPNCSPGFQQYQSPSVVDRHGRVLAQKAETVVDPGDARRIAVAVVVLPEPHRKALNWYYLRGTSPFKGCMEVGATMEHLHRLVRDGRQMLVNRGV